MDVKDGYPPNPELGKRYLPVLPTQHHLDAMQDLRFAWNCECDPMVKGAIGRVQTKSPVSRQWLPMRRAFMKNVMEKAFGGKDLFPYLSGCPFSAWKHPIVQEVRNVVKRQIVSKNECLLDEDLMPPVVVDAICLYQETASRTTNLCLEGKLAKMTEDSKFMQGLEDMDAKANRGSVGRRR